MRRRSILWSWAVLLATACGAPAVVATPTTPTTADEARFVDAESGEPLTFEAVIDRVAESRVVYVGERHDRALDHDVQRRIAEALLARDGSLGIGFEMFGHPWQAALDAYAAGTLDEAGMLAQTEWEDRWGFDFAMYRPVVALGRRGVALIALNAPREVTRRVAREGLDALDEATRASLPELDFGVDAHRAAVTAALAHHPGMSDEVLERFYAAQVVWDETMAERASAALSDADAPARLLVLAGVMHVRPDAIPERAARRGARPYAIVRPVDEGELDEAIGAGLADVLVVTPAAEETAR